MYIFHKSIRRMYFKDVIHNNLVMHGSTKVLNLQERVKNIWGTTNTSAL